MRLPVLGRSTHLAAIRPLNPSTSTIGTRRKDTCRVQRIRDKFSSALLFIAGKEPVLKPFIVILTSIMAANAAIVTNYTDNTSATANIQYQHFVNNGGNQQNAAFINGSDPSNLSHSAFTAMITDGQIVDDAQLNLTLTPGALAWLRVAPYFNSTSSTYNPAFQATHGLGYTINVSSSAGSNSYAGVGSALNLDVLTLLNFATLLNSSASNRQIALSWQDTVDFVQPAAMPKDALPGGNNPSPEYRWALSAGVTGLTDLQLTLSEPPAVPEPGTAFLLGSSLLAVGLIGRRKRK